MGWPKGKPRPGQAEHMRKLHADPEFAAKNAERMRKLHADPEFAAKNAERGRERLRKLHADPEFAAKNAERLRKLHADPEFAAKLSQAREERLKRSCFHCGAKYRLVPLDGIDGEFECGDERACEKRIQANLRGAA